MDIKSLQEINSEYLHKQKGNKKFTKTPPEFLFWLSVILILVAIMSFNYNSFFTRPLFGYSLYLTEGQKNLLLVKSTDNVDPHVTAGMIYQNSTGVLSGFCSNNHQTVEIGLVKATFPKLGAVLSFLINKIYIVVIIAAMWVAVTLYQKAGVKTTRQGVKK